MKAAIAIISGRPNSGKTACLLAVIARARRLGLTCGGLVSHGLWNDGRKTGYMLEAVATGERRLLAESHPLDEADLTLDRFHFSGAGIAWGNAVLRHSRGIVVVDEFGALEAEEGGLWPGIDYLLHNHRGSLLIAVRPALRRELLARIAAIRLL